MPLYAPVSYGTTKQFHLEIRQFPFLKYLSAIASQSYKVQSPMASILVPPDVPHVCVTKTKTSVRYVPLTHVRSQPSHFAILVINHRLHYFFTGIHYKRTVRNNGLVYRFAIEQQAFKTSEVSKVKSVPRVKNQDAVCGIFLTLVTATI